MKKQGSGGVHKEESSRWLSIAKEDLKSARKNFDGGIYYVSAFLCQQSVEKSLKAAVISKEGKLIKSHDLVFLGKRARLPKKLLVRCDRLNGVYLDSRYGDVGGDLPAKKFSKQNAKWFHASAKEVLEWAEKHL